jgi:hypothetical protein
MCYLYAVPETSWAWFQKDQSFIFIPVELAESVPWDRVLYGNASYVQLIT